MDQNALYQPDHMNKQDPMNIKAIIAIAKFVEFLQENCSYPFYEEHEVAMSTALKMLALKYQELVDDVRLDWFGEELKKKWNHFFSASLRKLLNELPTPEELPYVVNKLHREEMQAKARAVGAQVVDMSIPGTSGGSTVVNGAYHVQIWENGVVKSFDHNGYGPVTISVLIMKNYNPGGANPNGIQY